jgi:hypothetical protein
MEPFLRRSPPPVLNDSYFSATPFRPIADSLRQIQAWQDFIKEDGPLPTPLILRDLTALFVEEYDSSNPSFKDCLSILINFYSRVGLKVPEELTNLPNPSGAAAGAGGAFPKTSPLLEPIDAYYSLYLKLHSFDDTTLPTEENVVSLTSDAKRAIQSIEGKPCFVERAILILFCLDKISLSFKSYSLPIPDEIRSTQDHIQSKIPTLETPLIQLVNLCRTFIDETPEGVNLESITQYASSQEALIQSAYELLQSIKERTVSYSMNEKKAHALFIQELLFRNICIIFRKATSGIPFPGGLEFLKASIHQNSVTNFGERLPIIELILSLLSLAFFPEGIPEDRIKELFPIFRTIQQVYELKGPICFNELTILSNELYATSKKVGKKEVRFEKAAKKLQEIISKHYSDKPLPLSLQILLGLPIPLFDLDSISCFEPIPICKRIKERFEELEKEVILPKEELKDLLKKLVTAFETSDPHLKPQFETAFDELSTLYAAWNESPEELKAILRLHFK